jgi:hypothetical protein
MPEQNNNKPFNNYQQHESAKDAAEGKVNSERKSPLAEMLREQFLEEVRGGLKAAGNKVDAIDNQYENTPTKQARAALSDDDPANSSSNSGPRTKQHPDLPIAEGIADNFVLPASAIEADSSENNITNQLQNKLTLDKKLELQNRQVEKLRQRQRPANKAAPDAPAPRPNWPPRNTLR